MGNAPAIDINGDPIPCAIFQCERNAVEDEMFNSELCRWHNEEAHDEAHADDARKRAKEYGE